ncbi:MAG: hypothetical protein FWC11_02165 [Firmicutes bacterium]|nr:hypothetical protein [Bacillota bacterium]
MNDNLVNENDKATKAPTSLEKAKLSVTKPNKATKVGKSPAKKADDVAKQLKADVKKIKTERDEILEQIKAELGETLGKKGQLRDLRVKELEALQSALNARSKREIMELEKKAGLEVDEEKFHKAKIKEVETERKAANAKAKRELVGMGVDYAVKKPPTKKPKKDPIVETKKVEKVEEINSTPMSVVQPMQIVKPPPEPIVEKFEKDEPVQEFKLVESSSTEVMKEVATTVRVEDGTLTKMLEKLKHEIYLISKDLDKTEEMAKN